MGYIAKNIAELKNYIFDVTAKSKRIVMVNGCFDLFHAGHLDLLRVAKEHGDVLVVAVNSDKSVRGNKGMGRPIIGEAERVAIVAAIRYVDCVVLFEESDPREVIRVVRPDSILKEAEYRERKIAEQSVIDECGSEVVFYERAWDVSTSEIVTKIQNLPKEC